MKLKARSRLQPSGPAEPSLWQKKLTTWWRNRQSKVLTLCIGLAAYSYLGYVFSHVQPSALENWLLPNSYLPVLMAAFLGHWYVLSFLFLHPRRAAWISLALSWWLWLKLHAFLLDLPTLIGTVVCLLIIELILTGIEKLRQRRTTTFPTTGRPVISN
jgi:hypothetical protein